MVSIQETETWVVAEQRLLLDRSEQRLQSIEAKGPGLATVSAVVAAAVGVALSLTWKDATCVEQGLMVLSAACALLSLVAPIQLVGPIARRTITAKDLREVAGEPRSEAALGRRYQQAAAENDLSIIRLSNLQAAARNDLRSATVLFVIWALVALI